MSKDKIPDIPSPAGIDRELERVLNPIIENLRIYRGVSGDPLDEVVTVGEFAELLSTSAVVQDLIVEAHTHPEYLPLDGSGAMIGTLFLTHTILPQISCRATDSGASHALFQNTTTGNATTDGLYVGITSVETALLWNYESTNLDIGTNAKRHIQCVPDAATNLYYNANLKASTTNTGFDINGDLVLSLGATIDEFSTDGTLAGNSDIACPTEQASKTYIDNRRRIIQFVVFDSGTSVATGNGVEAMAILADWNGLDLQDAIANVHTQGITGTTDIMVRRRRAGSDVDMLSTPITIGAEYYANDGVVDGANDDIATGDQIYIDVDAVHSGTAPLGLTVALEFGV